MKQLANTHSGYKGRIYAVLILIIVLLHFSFQSKSSFCVLSDKTTFNVENDTLMKVAIKGMLANKTAMSSFNYPKSVERFYLKSELNPGWIKDEKEIRRTWEALLMLDCVLQFGLSHADYHPSELEYETMHNIYRIPSSVSPAQKARFDMMLTDAMITFIYHLHFGKLNPVYTAERLDNEAVPEFCAEKILYDAKTQSDFMNLILNLQPKSRAYILMQEHMRLMKGQYLDDCYEVPEETVRKLAINMERLRWAGLEKTPSIRINIPSYSLALQFPDSVYQFKVIVGKAAWPTPILQSVLSQFSTAPDWRVPGKIFVNELLPKIIKNPGFLETNHFAIYDLKGNYIDPIKNNLAMIKRNPGQYFLRQSAGCDNALGRVVFRFANTFGIYLHDTPEQQLFNREFRALSHGCIRVEEAGKMAALLLEFDGTPKSIKVLHQAMAIYEPKTFTLKSGIPIQTLYLTCEIVDGQIKNYEDVYNMDKALEQALYQTPEATFTTKLKKY
ncbi:L,D-transpeptidase scaffold domain-containing protein [Pedobacter caeni]|uniref:L,D-transpeptidase catalytic domain n=1 Tax=Pedobacter caeni TaxID=288992 RepID=A0A1M5BBA1_9SPHI|nr:L,D-transpeptidase family protein [Pedobacter caeni]SHF39708.1 L,D-transpeptidase catalytic domain [Pedobacter caeni]